MPPDAPPAAITLRDRLILPVIVLVVLIGVVVSSLLSRETAAIADLTDATVVAQLGSYQKAYPEDLRKAVQAARAQPDNLVLAAKAARASIDFGRRTGDARLVGTALGLLAPWLKSERPAPEVLLLAATALQYNHDFTGALALLDRALSESPGYADALMLKADIEIVQGRSSAAVAICRKVAGTGRVDLGLVCDATARALTADAAQAYERLAALTAIEGAMDPQVRTYALGLLAEIALFQGWRDKAEQGLAAALAAQPDDLRTMMVYADVLLADGKPQAALDITANAPPTDGIVLRRAIAWRDLGDRDAVEPLRAVLQNAFDLQRQMGLAIHAREEARFELEIVNDPSAALERAIANWAFQRELEDAQLLLDAADVAGSPEAAKPVLDWMRAEGVVAPALHIPDSVRALP